MQEDERPTDEALVEQARRGDEPAFGELMRRYQREIYGFVYALLNDVDEANDAVQEVFVQVLLSLPRFQSGRRFAPWLYGIASHVARNAQRQLRRRAVSLEEVDAASPLIADVSTWPDHVYAVEERRRRIHAAVAALPPDHAQVVVLHYFQRLSYQDIAERLQPSENAVKMRLFRAREKRREMLADLV